MSQGDIPADFRNHVMAIGDDIYLWKHDETRFQRACIISAHGGRAGGRTFDLPAGITLKFYTAHGTAQIEFGLLEIVRCSRQPVETVTGPRRYEDYELSKYQGRHSEVGETYRVIAGAAQYTDDWYDLNRDTNLPHLPPLDIVTIRHRRRLGTLYGLSSGTTLSTLITQLRQRGAGYQTFHCYFCRG